MSRRKRKNGGGRNVKNEIVSFANSSEDDDSTDPRSTEPDDLAEVREMLKEEIREEYEEFIGENNILRKRLEVQDNYIKFMHENGAERIKKMEMENKMKLEQLSEELYVLKEEAEEMKRQNVHQEKKLQPMHDEVNDEDGGKELPEILRGENRLVLEKIVPHLDPNAFSRFIRSSQKLYGLAENGFLSFTLALDCDAAQGQGVPFFIFNGKSMNVSRTMGMISAKWFRREIRKLRIWTEMTPHGNINGEHSNRKVMELLDLAGVKKIQEVEVQGIRLDADLFTKYKIRKITAYLVTWSMEQILGELPPVEELLLQFSGHSSLRALPSEINEFLEGYPASQIKIINAVANSFVCITLIRLWLCEGKKIKMYEFEVERPDHLLTALGGEHMPWIRHVEPVAVNMKWMTTSQLKSMTEANTGVLFCDDDSSWFLRRGDGVFLKGQYYYDRTSHKMRIQEIL